MSINMNRTCAVSLAAAAGLSVVTAHDIVGAKEYITQATLTAVSKHAGGVEKGVASAFGVVGKAGRGTVNRRGMTAQEGSNCSGAAYDTAIAAVQAACADGERCWGTS